MNHLSTHISPTSAQETIEEFFSLLHDGVILEGSHIDNSLNLKVEIPYLADIVNPEYSVFYVVLKECKSVIFRPWNSMLPVLSEGKEIFHHEMNILDARRDAKTIVVGCSMLDRELSCKGGMLRIEAESIVVFDEDFVAVSLTKMKAVAKRYWKNFVNIDES